MSENKILEHRGPFDVHRDSAIAMTTRDGVQLRADVYRPIDKGTFPVLVRRTPYGSRQHDMASEFNEAHYFASHGYIVVVQDVRGRYSSDGIWTGDEGPDGYDTVEWAAGIEGSSGVVGTFGQSYGAILQYELAALRPPHLRTCIPISGCVGPGPLNGMVELGFGPAYSISMAEDTYRKAGRGKEFQALHRFVKDQDVRFSFVKLEALRELPISIWVDRLGLGSRLLAAEIEAANKPLPPAYDPQVFKSFNVPMLHIGSWYDLFVSDTLKAYRGIRDNALDELARQNQAVIMGPWAHLLPYNLPTSGDTGDIDFGDEAAVFLLEAELRWFDHYLKRSGQTLPRPAVRIFVMGENRWRDEPDWPLARSRSDTWYLHSAGSANTLDGDGTMSRTPPADEPEDRFRYVPEDPVITAGGRFIVEGGVRDQRSNEARRDVLVYTSEPLAQDLELAGSARMILHASTTALDTDFFVSLVDVHPNGFAQNLLDAGIRGRHRERGTVSPLEPANVYRFELDMLETCHVVFAGHRLRVHVTSSDFPRFDRNANSGLPIGTDTELLEADQAVFHDKDHPSQIVLSVVERSN